MVKRQNYIEEVEDWATIDTYIAATAFDKWQENNGRARRGSGLSSAQLFSEDIRTFLSTSKSGVPRSLGIPANKQGWSNWRTKRIGPRKRIPLMVCEAIKILTDTDITNNKTIDSSPMNATDMVRLGSVKVKKATNGAAEECCISLEYINFKTSTAEPATREIIQKNSTNKDQVIGTVRYALYAASLWVKSGSEISDALKLSAEQNASGISFVRDRDDRSHLRWQAMPQTDKDTLFGDIGNLELAKGELSYEDKPVVVVSVARCDIKPVFSPNNSVNLSESSENDARDQLIEQVLRNRFPDKGSSDRFILSYSNVMGSDVMGSDVMGE